MLVVFAASLSCGWDVGYCLERGPSEWANDKGSGVAWRFRGIENCTKNHNVLSAGWSVKDHALVDIKNCQDWEGPVPPSTTCHTKDVLIMSTPPSYGHTTLMEISAGNTSEPYSFLLWRNYKSCLAPSVKTWLCQELHPRATSGRWKLLILIIKT